MLATTIPSQQRDGSKLKGTFYALQRAELVALKASKLIDNCAYVYFALKILNPFCDRPVELVPKQFAQDWSIPVSSVYEAIAKLKRNGSIDIDREKIFLTWKKNSTNDLKEPGQESNSRNCYRNDNTFNRAETETKAKPDCPNNSNSEIPEPILKSQNQLQDPIIDSETPEKPALKLSSDKAFSSLQTIQIVSDPPDRKQEEQSVENKWSKKLSKLNIDLDKRVVKALNTYSPEQIEAALEHVEKTWDTIRHPRAVFLYQLPKQKPKSKSKTKAVKTVSARDFGGWTIEMLKKMYPTKWQEAAVHFGLSQEVQS